MPTLDRADVEVRRSRRRTRTVSAYRQDGKVIVMIPARFSRAEEAEWVDTMLARLARSDQRRRRTDATLTRRARELSDDYLHGRARPTSIRWVSNMTTRWGSCTTTEGTIRLSDRLQQMPGWVVDYVLLHELAHLLEPGHNERFWRWVDQYPRAERAKGYLEGVAHAERFWRWVDQYPRAERAKGYLEGVAHAAALGLAACGPEDEAADVDG